MISARSVSHWGMRLLLVMLALVLVAVIGVVAWAKIGVMAAEQAPLDAVQARPGVTVEEDATAIVVSPENPEASGTGLVFYPGAKVEPAAYVARLADLTAEHEITAVIVKPHLNLALLDRRDLDTFTSLAGEVQVWMVGGHSLGGVRACQLAEDADALVLFASYCANDLSSTQLPVLSLAGSEDGLSTPEKIDEARDLLPEDARLVEIQGAAHASFGDYGEQNGGGTARIGDREMTAQVTELIAEFAEPLPDR
ncbi:alpha/beta hydrolase [Brachybacterium avium]|uniref:Alpha/beta hydrolase n=1 Tax=Brachybacterium avium TaxID=2017485 RepID=A0A220UDF8_9MICO|nr:alpha/beta hydrolase [Brachybacterium avium]ASK66135.1 alpha/beta hydrolase [Brachybacterium avium]